MFESLSWYIYLLFGMTIILTLFWFYIASGSRRFLAIATGWIILQSTLGLVGFYENTEVVPPRLMIFGVFPAIILIISLFFTRSGNDFINRINLKTLTYFHAIRIPVEIVLALLFHQGLVSIYMTFEGTNFDIVSGVSAPIVAYFAFRTNSRNNKLLFWWNIISLILLLNVVITAVFALPSPFQKLSLAQPNRAVLYFPFNLLPAFIVPTVLFSHFVAFRKLKKRNTGNITRGDK